MAIDGPMDIDAKIRACVDAFVAELTDLIREAAVEKVAEALTGGSVTRGRTRGAARVSAGRAGGKRTSDEIETQCDQIAGYVSKNPGQGVDLLFFFFSGQAYTKQHVLLRERPPRGDERLRVVRPFVIEEGKHPGTRLLFMFDAQVYIVQQAFRRHCSE